MTQEITVEDQVIDVLHHLGTCDIEEVMRQCPGLTWNQVFLAVDRLSRRGVIRLVLKSRGAYSLVFSKRQEDRPNHYSLPS